MRALGLLLPASCLKGMPTSGHYKDIENIALRASRSGFLINRYYLRSGSVYVCDKDVPRRVCFLRDFCDWLPPDEYILAGPVFALRSYLWVLPTRAVLYLADSLVKTAVHDVMRRPWFFHRLVYAAACEWRLRHFRVVVASVDELCWMTGVGQSPARVRLIHPSIRGLELPGDASVSAALAAPEKILILNPSGDSVQELPENIAGLKSIWPSARIVVTGTAARVASVKNPILIDKDVEFVGYVDDLDGLIKSSDVCVVTDRGGSGFCNRSLHVRALGIPLLTTIEGLRGTCLENDEGVFYGQNIREAALSARMHLMDVSVQGQMSAVVVKAIERSKKQIDEVIKNWFI